MTRALAFLFRNWPLKLAAIVLASLLYAGLVLSQNVEIWPGSVPIEPRNLPTTAVLLTNLDSVMNIRYFAPVDVRVTSSTFTASVDLSGADPRGGPTFLPVRVEATDQRVTIIDFDPKTVRVELDPLITRTVPVQVDKGTVPAGLQVREPELSVTEVRVSGPASVVRLATAARARVLIQPSGLSVNQDVPLEAVDAVGNTLSPVSLEPDAVHVKILVGNQLQTKSLAVNPVVTGTPANGFEIVGVQVDPAIVTVEGDADALASLARVDTAPVSISGVSADRTTVVALALPDGVDALSASTIRVTVHLREVTATRDFSAGLVLSGARDDRTYTLSVDSVIVTLGGTVADLDRLSSQAFAATVGVGGLTPGPHVVPVQLNLPAGLSVVGISPPSVTVTVGAAPTISPSP